MSDEKFKPYWATGYKFKSTGHTEFVTRKDADERVADLYAALDMILQRADGADEVVVHFEKRALAHLRATLARARGETD